MTPDDSFLALMTRLRSGDDEAASTVFLRFASRLISLARSHIDGRLRHKVDPEDVVQSVYKSFFRRHEAELLEVTSWDGLWGLLTLITVRKCIKRVAYLCAERRDARREVGLQVGSDSDSDWNIIDREPSPEEAALMIEAVEQVLQAFDPDDREVIELTFQGYSTEETSARLNRAERSVRRLRERARKRLERMLEANPGDDTPT
jgi:RNA polymerase sigma-70 factor (ECF subfamily)